MNRVGAFTSWQDVFRDQLVMFYWPSPRRWRMSFATPAVSSATSAAQGARIADGTPVLVESLRRYVTEVFLAVVFFLITLAPTLFLAIILRYAPIAENGIPGLNRFAQVIVNVLAAADLLLFLLSLVLATLRLLFPAKDQVEAPVTCGNIAMGG